MVNRASRKQIASAAIDFTDPVVETRSPPPEPPDPACVAVRLLLIHALEICGTTVENVAVDGTVTVVLLPTADWREVAVKEWTVAARRGLKPDDGFHDRSWREGDWVAWDPVGIGHLRELREANEAFARAVSRGRHCAGFAADLTWLPSDLVNAADHRLVLPPLTSEDVRSVAREICCSEPTDTFFGTEAATLTPRLLRLARRPGQTADAYIRKLCDLLEHENAPDKQADTRQSISIRESPTLDRLHGMDEAVKWGMNLANDLRQYKEGQLPWSAVDRGLLLSGPPGCGKTLYARALATTCGLPLVTGSYGEWHGSGSAHQGDLLKAMAKTFKQARDQAPAILFIDEVDSFPNRSTIKQNWADWEIQVVNALLAQVDGVKGREGVVLVAACNHPDKLDPALVRSGRLDRHIRVELPNRAALAAIMREHLGDELPDDYLLAPALAATGSSGADCERFVRGARRRARNASRSMVIGDLINEIRGADDRTIAELNIAAIHEAGHAVAICELHPRNLHAVTLAGSGDFGGGTRIGLSNAYYSAGDINRLLVVLLAGRAAEEVFLKKPTSGAGGGDNSDLSRATRLAATAAASLGLDATSGLLWLGVPDAADFFRLFRDQPVLAARARIAVEGAYAEALSLIRRRATAVKALAVALLEKRALDGEEAAAIVQGHSPDPAVELSS